MSQRHAIRVGQLISSSANRLGTCKAVGSGRNGGILVHYFDSIARPQIEMEIPRADISLAPAMPQTRGYFQDEEGDWRVGRVTWRQGAEYALRLPGGHDAFVSEKDLYVRWQQPIEDPTEILILRGNESPYYHMRRQPFMRSLLEQRAAAQGLDAILSSVVELHSHQIETARRVLQDPVQRYLLADEVGLGKTIEAGFIIRQHLLDHPTASVAIIVPPLLIPQWEEELENKFLIRDFPAAGIDILSAEEPAMWPSGEAISLLVVDEAHHIAAEEREPGERYEALASLSAAVPRVLLLSATPVLNNEGRFHAMLHLIDPELHDLEDLEGFTERVHRRQELGTIFYTFQPDSPAFLLAEKAEALRTFFPTDQRLLDLLDKVAAESGEDNGSRVEAVQAVRVHVSETYRLHRRLLRTRRDEALLETFPVKGRRIPTSLIDPDPLARDMHAWLDQWRDSRVASQGEDVTLAELLLFQLFFERSTSIPGIVGATARYRRLGDAKDAELGALTEAERRAIEQLPLVDGEDELLAEAEERFGALEEEAVPRRLQEAVQLLAERPSNSKGIAFTSFSTVARALHTALMNELGEGSAALHTRDQSPAKAADEIRRFGTDPTCYFLISDRSGEEGRNFQQADYILHIDMPWSPNQLEQRLGRVDRFGKGSPPESDLFVSGDPGAFLDTWIEILREELEVFSGSIASLQYAVEDLISVLQRQAWTSGVPGLREAASQIRPRLAEEREQITRQDALDSIEVLEEGGELQTSMQRLESQWDHHEKAADDLIALAEGNLRFHRKELGHGIVTYSFVDQSRRGRPALATMPLVAWDQLLTVFHPMMDRPGSWDRAAALAVPGSRVFRSGEQFIEQLAQYVRWDDRGQSFVMWRPLRTYEGDDLAAFRFDYVVEGRSEAMAEALEGLGVTADEKVLRRRADAYFAPLTATIWLNVSGAPVEDDDVLRSLEVPYSNRRDVNVHRDRYWVLESILPAAEWEDTCRRLRKASVEVLWQQIDLADRCRAASDRAKRLTDISLAQLSVRVDSTQGKRRKAHQRELEVEQALAEGLIEGIESPSVRLDSIGVVVLSRQLPEATGE